MEIAVYGVGVDKDMATCRDAARTLRKRSVKGKSRRLSWSGRFFCCGDHNAVNLLLICMTSCPGPTQRKRRCQDPLTFIKKAIPRPTPCMGHFW